MWSDVVYLVQCINNQILSPSTHLVRHPQRRPTGKEWTRYVVEWIRLLDESQDGYDSKDGNGNWQYPLIHGDVKRRTVRQFSEHAQLDKTMFLQIELLKNRAFLGDRRPRAGKKLAV